MGVRHRRCTRLHSMNNKPTRAPVDSPPTEMITSPVTLNASHLQSIVERPEMYFGNQSGYLREIAACDMGVRFQSGWDESASTHNHSLIPDGFVSLVCAKLEEGHGGPSWSARIEAHSNSEKEAWALFQEIWREYLSTQVKETEPSHGNHDAK